MNEREFRREMTELGLPSQTIDTVADIISDAENPTDAFERIHVSFPQIEIEELKKEFDMVCSQAGFDPDSFSDDSFELTEEELDGVNGGWCGWRSLFSATFHLFAKTLEGGLLGGGVCCILGPGAAVIGATVGVAVGLAAGIVDVVNGDYALLGDD